VDAGDEDYRPSTYGDRIADVYDRWFTLPDDAEPAAAFLAELAGAGPALELGIGTGRVALPLAQRGVTVNGVDASDAIVAKLREKPGGSDIPVTIGDFAAVGDQVDGTYSLVYVVFNTFFALLAQEDQVRCFQGVSERLAPTGVFVIQAFVPDLTRFDRGSRVAVTVTDVDEVMLEVGNLDLAAQRIATQHVVVVEDGLKMYPVRLRYAWPAELDLMARLAGMRLRDRWAGWGREPFGSRSGQHISVYERAEAP
jgi:SAM-dependent methyltransferase